MSPLYNFVDPLVEFSALLVLALGHVRELLAKWTVRQLELLLALLLDLLGHVLFVII